MNFRGIFYTREKNDKGFCITFLQKSNAPRRAINDNEYVKVTEKKLTP